MKLTERLDMWAHPLMAKYVAKNYSRKIDRIKHDNPSLFVKIDPAVLKKFHHTWDVLGLRANDDWARFFVNLTGVPDPFFCPPDVYYAKIERVLNDCNCIGVGPENKNDLSRYLPRGYEPEVVVRWIRGSFFDREYKWVSKDAVVDLLKAEERDLVGKPCLLSGGTGVRLFRRDGGGRHMSDGIELTPEFIAKQDDSYIVQRKIVQSDFGAQFNKSSINTVRMTTLRRPWDGKIEICRAMMRLGVSDTIVDNMSKGGICVALGHDGSFWKYGYDYNGRAIDCHPVCGLRFEGLRHPYFPNLFAAAEDIHARIPFYNIISFDLVARPDGSVCCVELNATAQGIIQTQYGFGGLFGETTEKVVEWCRDHMQYDRFNHFRTWY